MERKAILDGDPVAGKIVTEVRREAGLPESWQACVFAMVVTIATLGVRLALDGPLNGRPTLILFTVPIMLSAYMGGWRAGLLATMLSYFLANYYLLPPLHSFRVAIAAQRWDLFFVMLAGGVISALNEALHRARRRADFAIRERVKEDRKRFFALSPDVLCTLGFNGYFRDLNPAWEKTLGYTNAELLATPFIEFVHPDDRPATLAEAEKVAEGKELTAFENRYRCKDGSYRRFQWSATRVIEDQVIYGAARDITERRQEQAALLKAAALQNAIFSSAYFSCIAIDETGVIQLFNVGAERMLGYKADEVLDKITPADLRDPQEAIARAKALSQEFGIPIAPGFDALVFKASRGIEDVYELTKIRKDGSRFPAVASVTALRAGQGGIIGYLLIDTDNTPHKRADKQAADILRKFDGVRTALNEHDIVAITDAKGKITYVNDKFCAISRYSREELLGRDHRIINSGFHSKEFIHGLWLTISSGRTWKGDIRNRAKDGTFYWVDATIVPCLGEDGIINQYIAIRTDITARKNFEEALRQTNVELEVAKSAAEKANLAKSDFISSMSHELRTPLNAILGFAQLMESASPAPTASEAKRITQILQAGWFLLKLINEILDLAVIESGNVSLSKEAVSLSELLDECQGMMEPQAHQRGIRMTFPLFDAPVFVSADRTRLKQVIINLVSNAIKYNKNRGTVVVDCTARAPERMRISVTDTGVGLSPEKLAQLFQPFNRLGQEAGRVAGTGIGLVVSKRLVELMGGSLGVESTAGAGSVFWCELSLTEAPQTAVRNGEAGASVQPEAPSGVPRRTLLYVEDNPANMELVEELVARFPQTGLVTAANGTLGIELARATQPDVILMDINLPGISGLKALKILRADPATAHIPVIALSANAMPRDIAKGLQAGFFRYLTKPIKINEFMDTLHLALECAEEQLVEAGEAGSRP